MDRNFFSSSNGERREVGRSSRIDYDAIDTAVGQRLAPQVEQSGVQIEETWEIKIARLVRCTGRRFIARAMHAAVRERQMRRHFFRSIHLGLVGFDRAEGGGAGNRAIIEIELPQKAREVHRLPGSFELETLGRWSRKSRFRGRGGETTPAKMITGFERRRCREISRRILCDSGLPTRSQAGRAECHQSGKTDAALQPTQSAQKNTRGFGPRVFSIRRNGTISLEKHSGPGWPIQC